MKYATEMGSGAMIYVPSFIKFGVSLQNTQTHKQKEDLISPL
jgi:hypothetical protein